jgi:hypothetical protein
VKRSRVIIALATAGMLAAAAPAIGQTKAAPTASASASASAAPSAQPASSGSLPPGHPPVGHGGDAQAQGDRDSDPRFFTPPQDVALDDPSLPAGSIVVVVKDAKDKPLPGAPITLSILHSSVARGEARDRKSAVADADGAARFDGLSVGTGHSYEAITTRGPARYGYAPVGLGDKVGKRITVHAYDASSKVEDLAVAMQGLVFASLREDSIQVEQLVSVYNLGPIAWTADTTFPLPKGFKAFNKQESTGDARVEEVSGTGAALRGTFPPGRTDLDFRYQIPLEGSESQTFKIGMPPRVAQARVIAESSKTMTLNVTGFGASHPTTGRDGKRLLVSEHQATRAEGGVPAVEITLGGLPTPGQGRWVAVALAILALGAGFWYFLEHRDTAVDDDARQDLIEAREALLSELVALERAFKSGEVGPKSYNRIRASLTEALARIVRMLDEAKPPPRKGARPKAEPAT